MAVRIEGDIWVFDLERGTRTRLTFEGDNDNPVWTPDGERITYSAAEDIHWKRADGSGDAELLLTGEYPLIPCSWSPDGNVLAFFETKDSQRDIWVLPLEGDRGRIPFFVTPFNERSPSFSPDGRFVAYVSDESGRDEVYLQPYPGPGGKVPVSTDGGREPAWCPKGGELFYRTGDRMKVVSIETAPTLKVGIPRVLFEGRYLATDRSYGDQLFDVSSDCQQFVMTRTSDQAHLNVVLNWSEELKRLVPTE